MSKQPRSATAELVRLAGNIIYVLILLTLAVLFLPVVIGVLIYRRYYRED